MRFIFEYSASARWALGLAALGLLALAPSTRAGVTVALQPASQTVAPGAEFDVFIAVTQAGSAFNAFDAVIGHDPGALTLLSLSPISLQEGALMTSACGNRFHQFHADASSGTATDVLLCNGVSLTGPGQIYRLHYRASNTPQVTTVQFLPGLKFYNAGLYVTPVTSSNATIGIGTTLDVGDGRGSAALRVSVAPNPARATASVRIDAEGPGNQEVLVLDLLGRVVRHLENGYVTTRSRTIAWDGRSDAGTKLSAGIYRVQVRVLARTAESRLILLN